MSLLHLASGITTAMETVSCHLSDRRPVRFQYLGLAYNNPDQAVHLGDISNSTQVFFCASNRIFFEPILNALAPGVMRAP
ncbi:hypothetical protein K402DRAFT_101431 [Aulographum hederae CBS 113979]|uniref:Uncharacterized protein n=1 Tax=Aulographum hederae CBS 113979 TaxID=1176131 RepID=A0A6G1GYM2_9PEZI|nr:hypothetical protein K402DRAFT_101431 [Aulographum hederae CBS 113979]